jgi:hypothetical protein
VRLKGFALDHLASIHQNGRTVPSSGTKICGKRLVAEPSATARDQKPVDDLHPNGVMRQVASGKRGKFLSELGQDLKLPFDVANWDFQLCGKWEPCQPPRRQITQDEDHEIMGVDSACGRRSRHVVA